MTRQRTCFRLVFLVVAVILLASAIGLVACSKPQTAAPAPAPTPAPVQTPTPAPDITPVPSQQPQEGAEGLTTTPAHHFWGQVKTDTGVPAPGVEITAWINGKQRGSITTDSSGQYGRDPLEGLPYYLNVNGSDGDVIEFRVDGVTADEIRWGVLIMEGKPHWQWDDIETSWQTVYASGGVNGLDLVYTH